jgi:hypothetical protein
MTAAGLSLLMLTGGVWVSQTALHPPVAQAYKNRVDVRLDRLKDETYQSLIRRAEIIARAAAQRSFDRDILMGEVSIMVLGEYQGAEAPLLLLEVSRENWRQRPDTRRWATYYRTAKRLLKLPSAADPVRPNVAPQPVNPGIPNVEPVQAPIVPPPTESPRSGPGVTTPAQKPGAPVPVPSASPKPGVPVPVPSPSASPKPGVPVPVPTPSSSPAVPAVPQTTPKVAPKPAKPAKPKAKPQSAAAQAAEAAAKAAEAAAKAGDAMKK